MNVKPRTIPSEIPTSSMADIAFLLVIYFMLTITFSATQGLDLSLPKDRDSDDPIDPVESVLVQVHGQGRLTVDGNDMALSGLLPYLEPKLRRNPGKPVILRAVSAAPYGAMVDVLDELRQGKDRLGLEREIQVALPTDREAQLWERPQG
jgi:biopolymer transport protein ExbD